MLNKDQKNDFNSLLPGQSSEAGASRRTALKAALDVGYAAAALPIMAQTAIKTPAADSQAAPGVRHLWGKLTSCLYRFFVII